MVDPKLLEGLSEAEKAEALAAEAAARRGEERAERRALERAQAERQAQREREKHQEQQQLARKTNGLGTGGTTSSRGGLVFVRRKDRKKKQDTVTANAAPTDSNQTSTTASSDSLNRNNGRLGYSPRNGNGNSAKTTEAPVESAWSAKERAQIEQTYLGSSASDKNIKKKKRIKSTGNNKKLMFKFQWDDQDDTAAMTDHLYAAAPITTAAKRKRKYDANSLELPSGKSGSSSRRSTADVWTKPWSEMTQRDWRIIRETYDIVVKSGGSIPPPLRKWQETTSLLAEDNAKSPPMIHPTLLRSIRHVLRFDEPSPIQRQGIPIGLVRRDFVGLAETGSGKTIAFGVPLAHYILHLPNEIINRVADHGPLGIVLAPTRELALQIQVELAKLLHYASGVTTVAIVGGQPIQRQAQLLREGVHIVVGTPGRINDCLEMAYLVLNQCWYVVLDEADRMVDMGFAPQIESILDAMGGGAATPAAAATGDTPANNSATPSTESMDGVLLDHRLTAMFSATMPPEVERMAQTYLRLPAAVISIGDSSSRKNARIVQRLIYVSSPAQKDRALQDLLHRNHRYEDKIIIFCNEKKQADAVGRFLEHKMQRSCVVLHGGKSQEQRQQNLGMFRDQRGVILVATDVAGRGLDIPNVSHVINYDLPPRSNIDSYSHRIGRTGRAGKEGLATSLWTDDDEAILGPLKQYLQATNQHIPEKLARHKAVQNF